MVVLPAALTGCAATVTDCGSGGCVSGGGGGQGGGSGQGGGVGGGRVGGGSGGGGSDQGGSSGRDAGALIEPDAGVDPSYDGGCGPPVPGNPTIRHRCAPPTDNECDGVTDSALSSGGVPATRLNARAGNGFDDDCDGLVDEGCACPGNGMTKDCYLVPASQVAEASGLPVGWCAANAKGSLDCSGDEFPSWSGVCRGAQPPALVDTCSPGDFNCDGLDANNASQGCACSNDVQCPTEVITEAPYPPAGAIPVIDGSRWIVDAANRDRATNWTWTVLGGDCDNVLPFPTFALYNQAKSTASGARRGTRTPVQLDLLSTPAKYAVSSGSSLIAIRASGYGSGVTGGRVYPAFGLSGDYIVQGEFKLDGKDHVCTQKVQVRAPGIRAELCWDSVGGNDLDLHLARLQGAGCSKQGWDLTCNRQDCFYLSETGCVSDSNSAPGWGYADSADTACLGWSSKRDPNGQLLCTNPRLDRDNISCDRSMADPAGDTFCGPENINLDNPHDGDSFVVGVNHYGSDVFAGANSPTSRAHVNLYCNGERVTSIGYNPTTGSEFPVLNTPGADRSGDFWTVGTIKAHVSASGQLTGCDVATAPSRKADVTRDGPAGSSGGNPVCVDHGYSNKRFVENASQGAPVGSVPTQASQWCKH